MTKKLLLTAMVLLHTISIFAQQNYSVHGRVLSADGKPVEGISVSLGNKRQTTATDYKGHYRFVNVKQGDYTLKATGVGLQTRQQQITLGSADLSVPDIYIAENFAALNEVVIKSYKTNKFAQKSTAYVSKMPLKNLENPQVYTSITKDLIAEQVAFSIEDALRNAPGVQKMRQGSGRGDDGGTYYNLRGFQSQSKLRNGIAGNVISGIDVANLERVEIIKGPSATLFGNSLTSFGGLINRVTKKPYESFGGEINYATGSYGFNRISADVNTPLDSAKTTLVRINTALSSEDSFQDQGFMKSFVFAPSLTYKANDRLTFNFDAEMASGSNTCPQYFFVDRPVSELAGDNIKDLNIDYKRYFAIDDIFVKQRTGNFFGEMVYNISKEWTSQTNVSITTGYSDGPLSAFWIRPNNTLDRFAQVTRSTSSQAKELQQTFNGDFKIGKLRNRVVIGLDVFNRYSKSSIFLANLDNVQSYGNIPTYAGFNRAKLDVEIQKLTAAGTPTTVVKSNTYSAFVSDVINLTDNFMALAAVRLDRFVNDGTYNLASGETKGGYNQTALSPKFGLVFQPLKDRISLFANYQNSFNNQGEYGAYDGGPTPVTTSAKPSFANQLEGGVKFDLFNGRLTSTLTYYDIKVTNILRGDSRLAGTSIQDGTQLSKGVEAEVMANPVDGLNIVAGFSYNESKLSNAVADVNGRRPNGASSPIAANFWASYRIPQGKLSGLGLGFGGNYIGDNKIVNSVSQGIFTLPAFTILNASVFYDYKKFRIAGKIDNLTDQKSWIALGNSFGPQKLRNFGGSLTYKF
jgi:iron complex outermembrane receptor protein